MDTEKAMIVKGLEKRYFAIFRFMRHNSMHDKGYGSMMYGRGGDISKRIEESMLEYIKDSDKKRTILKKADMFSYKRLRKARVTILTFDNSYYLYLQVRKNNFLFKDIKEDIAWFGSYIWMAYWLVFFVIVLSFIVIIRAIYPIKRLRNEIIKFGDGDLTINCATTKKDEISQVANEFNRAISKVRNLIESRTVFLRNIMHELKTPITKGKISVELIDNSREKEILSRVFSRLEQLIEEFANIEKVTSNSYSLNMKSYRLIDVVDHAIDLLYASKDSITIDVGSSKANLDFEIFAIAVKNLIENALSYSTDKHIIITQTRDFLQFVSSGDPLAYPFEVYLKPFFGDWAKNDSGHFGLGLYIVKHIVSAHGFDFSYEAYNGENYFTIHFS
jgi:two-component system OmpR family sensor kinase